MNIERYAFRSAEFPRAVARTTHASNKNSYLIKNLDSLIHVIIDVQIPLAIGYNMCWIIEFNSYKCTTMMFQA